jgi:hypothetical protein
MESYRFQRNLTLKRYNMAGSIEDDATTDHGILVTAKWDWTYSDTPGRWSRPQQGIKPRAFFIPTDVNKPRDTGYGVLKSRLKIRGKGDALVIRFESEEGKDFQLLGWSVPYTVETET